MTDLPSSVRTPAPTGLISTVGEGSNVADFMLAFGGTVGTAAAWPAVNQAIYVSVVVSQPVTVYQMALLVGVTAAGNVDVGIYDVNGSRIVSSTPTPIGAAGPQVFDIANTELNPGNYFLAAWCSTVTTATFNRYSAAAASLERVHGVQIQTGQAGGLPATATFASATSGACMPLITASFMQATI